MMSSFLPSNFLLRDFMPGLDSPLAGINSDIQIQNGQDTIVLVPSDNFGITPIQSSTGQSSVDTSVLLGNDPDAEKVRTVTNQFIADVENGKYDNMSSLNNVSIYNPGTFALNVPNLGASPTATDILAAMNFVLKEATPNPVGVPSSNVTPAMFHFGFFT